jgi:hypothetical protein
MCKGFTRLSKTKVFSIFYLKQGKVINNIKAERLRTLEEDNRNLTDTLQSFAEEFNILRLSSGRPVSNYFARLFTLS